MNKQEMEILKEAEDLWQKLSREEHRNLERIFGGQGGKGSMPAIVPVACTDAYHLYRDICDLFGIKPDASIDELAYQYGKMKGAEKDEKKRETS